MYSRLFSAAHYVRLVLAVVELVLSAEFLVFVPGGEELQLGEAAGELVRVQTAADLAQCARECQLRDCGWNLRAGGT